MEEVKSPVANWLKEVKHALKREKPYRREGQKIVEIYEGKRTAENPFAILYSNTETLQPSVYNSRPIPIVERKFKDADPLGKAGADVATRVLKFLIDEEPSNFDPFDDLMQAGVLDALLTNRGVTKFRFSATQTPEGGYANECVYGENIRWDTFFHGYARSWKKVPWIGFEHTATKDEFERLFPETKGKANYNFLDAAKTNDEGKTITGETKDELSGVELVTYYEIWDKREREQLFVSPCFPDDFLKKNPDPLGLKGFFPVPRPLNFQRKITTLVPTPLYKQYEDQAQELNELTRRLRHIIKAVKVRGFYDSTVDEIEKVLEAEDNVLIPVANRAAMGENMKMADAIWLMPFAELVSAAQSLYQEREACKQVIYEITGISDILRGSSVASETATAQNIKNQWGTLRLKKLQKEVQRYVRDCFRLMVEIASRFTPETLAKMTGLQFPTDEEKAAARQELELGMMQVQAAGQQFEPPPEAMQLLQTPSWEEIQALLADDILRDYKIDIETNSTIDAEASQDKQDIAELLNALSQFLNGIAPLVEQGVMPHEVAKQVLLTISRRYTFGPQLEDALNQMKAPEAKPDPRAEADAQKQQFELKKLEQEAEVSAANVEQEKELAQIKLMVEQEKLNMEREKIGLERMRLANQAEFAREQHRMKMEQLVLSAQMAKKKAEEPREAAEA